VDENCNRTRRLVSRTVCGFASIATQRGRSVALLGRVAQNVAKWRVFRPSAVARNLNPLLASGGDGQNVMTNAAVTASTTRTAQRPDAVSVAAPAQKVVIVNGSTEMLQMLETLLEAGHYNVVFVEAIEHAYSQIKRVQPNLVILCVSVDDVDGFQVLSMLKLDKDTRDIPVLTYTTEYDVKETEAAEGPEEPSEEETLFTPKPALLMN
jgi:CheY-like chemotaxis protein